jgi:signal transduction histidine kinase
MMSVRRGLGAAFTLLLASFLGVVLAQVVVTERLHRDEQRHWLRVEQARVANLAVRQHMTDAETGVRGYQLTGEPLFLAPYRSGRAGVTGALDRVAAGTRDDTVWQLLAAERRAVSRWLDGYAAPVTAGFPDPGAARGRDLFDAFRAANSAVDAAVRAELEAAAAAAGRRNRIAQLSLAAAAVAFMTLALGLAVVHQRRLLAPLDHIRRTLRRLAAGDRTARATDTGPAEMRALIRTLNDMAARSERMRAEDEGRSARNEVRQAVAAALRDGPDHETAARRVIETVGRALGADAVHGRAAAGPGAVADLCWPPGAPPLPPDAAETILAGPPGVARVLPGGIGAVAVPIAGDVDHPPGWLYLIRHTPPDWPADELRLLSGLGRDIQYVADQRCLQHRQSRLIGELRALDERKDAFVATVTHELRTPLTGILGYAEMLADGDCGTLAPQQQRGVAAILRNARRLQDTVGDLLLLDRSGAGGDVYTAVDVADLLAGICAELEPAARVRSVTVTGTAEPARACGDAGQLAQVAHNLLDNAIKFSRPGGRVTWEVRSGPDGVTLTVADTGMGIPDDELPLLFTPFHRAANAREQAVQGSGLGLAVVRTIVTEHGGTVGVRSQLGEGTTFTVTLPGAAPAPLTPASAEAPADG